jgi:hypothetical protein
MVSVLASSLVDRGFIGGAIYQTRGEHANHYTTDEHAIYQTRDEHA